MANEHLAGSSVLLFAAFLAPNPRDVVLNILPQDQLDLILRRHAEILARLAGAIEPEAFVALSRELAGIENVAKAIQDFRKQAEEAAGLEALVAAIPRPAPRCAALPRRNWGRSARGYLISSTS